MPRLRRVDCAAPGIRRVRRGRGFSYRTDDGEKVTDPETLQRISDLAIPPAWDDVWICPAPNGHIQAVGTDDAGRRQYRYHDAWRVQRDREKFDRVLDFALALPPARDRALADLEQSGVPKTKVLGGAFRLLDLGFFRIGGEEYAEKNNSYGLATLHKDHVSVSRDGVIEFDYPAKHGKQRVQTIVDPAAADLVRMLKRRRSGGPELLAYRAGRTWADVRSDDINAYIRELTGDDHSAKDFRTWHATVLCAVGLAVSATAPKSVSLRKRAVARAVKEVAFYLGNTPAVCRSAYIDPRVIDRYTDGATIARDLSALGEGAHFGELATQGAIEDAVLRLLGRRVATRRAS